MSDHKVYCRVFLEKHLKGFERAKRACPIIRDGPPGAIKEAAGKRAYYDHAIGAIRFMLKQLETYRQPPFYPTDGPTAA